MASVKLYPQSHIINIQSTYIYSVSSYLFSANMYDVFSLILFIFSQHVYVEFKLTCKLHGLILYIFSHLLNIYSVICYMYVSNPHLLFVNMFNVLCVTLRIWLTSVLFWKNECISYKIIFNREMNHVIQNNFL